MNDKTLVLDLDETLIHTVPLSRISSKKLPNPNYCDSHDIIGYERPYVGRFLRWARANFRNVGIFTAATPDYATVIVNKVFRKYGVDPDFVLASDDCDDFDIGKGEYWVTKPLRKLWTEPEYAHLGATPANTIAVDDKLSTAIRNPFNTIPIPAFEVWTASDTIDDRELLALIAYLDQLRRATDVRSIDKLEWRQ